jgi:threonine dehydratase/serine racemase
MTAPAGPTAGTYAADLAAVRAAATRIAPYAHRTPVLTCATLDDRAGRALHFKCENLQKIGAFKFRGACNAVMSLPEEVAARGVVTHSSGNHAQALALAARARGIDAHIVMPENALPVKRAAAEGYGATIYPCRPTLEDRERLADEVMQRTGATLVHPYDHPDIIAGQGTCGLELLEEVPDLDAIIAPVGGGGLLSGTCIAARAVKPDVRLFAGEPAGADDAARSLAAGRLIPQTGPDTIADGLLTSLGDLTWPIIRDHVEGVITVEDDAILAAMRLVMERMKVVIEPSAAVPVAAVLSPAFRALDGLERVGVILSGGNVGLDPLFVLSAP